MRGICLQYLERTDITDLTRENFTFSTKVKVGDFLQAQPGAGENVSSLDIMYIILSLVYNLRQWRLNIFPLSLNRERERERATQ